jgi:hypothetical protein
MESLLLFDISISAKLMARTSFPKIKKACARHIRIDSKCKSNIYKIPWSLQQLPSRNNSLWFLFSCQLKFKNLLNQIFTYSLLVVIETLLHRPILAQAFLIFGKLVLAINLAEILMSNNNNDSISRFTVTVCHSGNKLELTFRIYSDMLSYCILIGKFSLDHDKRTMW